MDEKRASWGTKINYGIGAMGKSLSYNVYGQLERYLRNILHIDDKFYLPLAFFEKLWDGVNDLMMGAVIDNTRSRWGKFRPWCAIGALLNSLMVVGTYGTPNSLLDKPVWLFIYVTVFYLLWDMTYTMVDVSYYALIPALSNTPDERNQFATIPRIFSGAVGIASAFIWNIVEYLGGGKGEAELKKGLFIYAIITSVIYVITSVYSAATVKEIYVIQLPKDAPKEKFSLVKAGKILWENKQVIVIVGIMILFNMANNLTNGSAGNYFYYVMGNTTQQGLYSIINGVPNFIGLIGFSMFSKWFGRTKVYNSSFFIPVVGYCLTAIVSAVMPGQFWPLAIVLASGSIGYGFMSVMQSVMLADAVDYGEYINGNRNEGIIFSMLTLLSKFAGAFSTLASTITYMIVKFGGKYPNDPTPMARKGISFLMYVLPPILLLLAFALYKTSYRLTPERMAQVKDEMEARKEEIGDASSFSEEKEAKRL